MSRSPSTGSRRHPTDVAQPMCRQYGVDVSTVLLGGCVFGQLLRREVERLIEPDDVAERLVDRRDRHRLAQACTERTDEDREKKTRPGPHRAPHSLAGGQQKGRRFARRPFRRPDRQLTRRKRGGEVPFERVPIRPFGETGLTIDDCQQSSPLEHSSSEKPARVRLRGCAVAHVLPRRAPMVERGRSAFAAARRARDRRGRPPSA